MMNREERTLAFFSEPDILKKMCDHVANGGTLLTLSETADIRYSDIMNWIHESPEREKRYIKALNDRAEWGTERFIHELKMLGLSDVRKLFNEDGSIMSPKDWPDDIARVVSSIEVNELFEGTGKDRQQIGVTKRVKLWDKRAALELLGKNLKLFTEKTEISVSSKLEDLLAGTYKEDKK